MGPRMIHARRAAVSLAYPRDPDGYVVAGVRSVGGELGIQYLSRVGHAAKAGHPGDHVVVDAGPAVALDEGDVYPDLRVGVWLDLDDVRLRDRGVRADGGNGARDGGVDGGAGARPHVEGARAGSLPAGVVHHVVVDVLWGLPARDEAEEGVFGEVLAARDHRHQPVALGVVAEARQACRPDGRRDADAGGLGEDSIGARVVRIYGDRLLGGTRGLRLNQNREDKGERAQDQERDRHEATLAVDAGVAPGLARLSQLRELTNGPLPGAGLASNGAGRTRTPTPGARRGRAPFPNILGLLSVSPSHLGGDYTEGGGNCKTLS